MAKGQLDAFVHPERYPDWVSRYEVQMQYKGFRRAMLETARADVFKRNTRTFTSVTRTQPPTLLLWGKKDKTVPFTQSDSVRAAFPHAEFDAIDDAGHLPHMEQAAAVDSILIGFLRQTPKPIILHLADLGK